MNSVPQKRGSSSRDLYKLIYESDHPEQFVRTIPAQSLYLLVKQRGLSSAADLVEMATIEQCRLFLDFDLWDKDRFREENLWEWLALSDDEDPLKFTQKLLKSVDLKLLSLIIARHVEMKIFDEPTDNPPAQGWYTPDKGYTWLQVITENKENYFLLNRLLALLFETSGELFYQLLSIPGVSTQAVLEEDSFQDRARRLSGEGMPEFSHMEEINSSLFPYEAKKLIEDGEVHRLVNDVPIVEPLLYDSYSKLEPLTGALLRSHEKEALEGELTLIMNASLEYFSIPVYEYDAVLKHTERVKGAVNIGLEKTCNITSVSADRALEILGLVRLYRLGLYELRALRKEALAIPFDEVKELSSDQKKFSVLAHLRLEFPEIPDFLEVGSDTSSETRPSSQSRAITSLGEIALARNALKSR